MDSTTVENQLSPILSTINHYCLYYLLIRSYQLMYSWFIINLLWWYHSQTIRESSWGQVTANLHREECINCNRHPNTTTTTNKQPRTTINNHPLCATSDQPKIGNQLVELPTWCNWGYKTMVTGSDRQPPSTNHCSHCWSAALRTLQRWFQVGDGHCMPQLVSDAHADIVVGQPGSWRMPREWRMGNGYDLLEGCSKLDQVRARLVLDQVAASCFYQVLSWILECYNDLNKCYRCLSIGDNPGRRTT